MSLQSGHLVLACPGLCLEYGCFHFPYPHLYCSAALHCVACCPARCCTQSSQATLRRLCSASTLTHLVGSELSLKSLRQIGRAAAVPSARYLATAEGNAGQQPEPDPIDPAYSPSKDHEDTLDN